MKRYTIHDRKVHDGQTFGYREGERWTVLDRETGRIVDEAATRYEAQQAVNGWNAGVYAEKAEEAPMALRSIRVPDQLWTEAQAVAKARGMSLSGVIRVALTQYVADHKSAGA